MKIVPLSKRIGPDREWFEARIREAIDEGFDCDGMVVLKNRQGQLQWYFLNPESSLLNIVSMAEYVKLRAMLDYKDGEPKVGGGGGKS